MLSSALYKGVTRATFHQAGTVASVIYLLLMRYVIEGASSASASLTNLAGIVGHSRFSSQTAIGLSLRSIEN